MKAPLTEVSFGLAMAAAILLLILPVYSGFDGSRVTNATLLEVNGTWAGVRRPVGCPLRRNTNRFRPGHLTPVRLSAVFLLVYEYWVLRVRLLRCCASERMHSTDAVRFFQHPCGVHPHLNRSRPHCMSRFESFNRVHTGTV